MNLKSTDPKEFDIVLEEKVRKSAQTIPNVIDTVLEEKVQKTQERISENMHILANEPSLAYYRLQENIGKSLPPMIDKRIEAEKLERIEFLN